MDPGIKQTADVSPYLSVGLLTLFHPEVNRKSERRYKSTIRGWREGTYILMDRPRVESGSYLMMRDGQDCLIRYTLEGKACGFVARVLDFEMSRANASMRLRWPDVVQYTYFRRGERVKCDVTCEVHTQRGQRMNGVIADMSHGGCGLRLDFPVDANSPLSLVFELPDGTMVQGLNVVACSVRKEGDHYFVGLRFDDAATEAKNDIAFFVSSRLAIMRGENETDAASNVLVIDEDAELVSTIAKTLTRKGLQCVAASHVVDAFHRLRAARPKGIAINFGFAELPAAEMIRLLRAAGVAESVPIVLYGGAGEGLAEKAFASGATEYVAPCPTLGPDVAFYIAKQLGAS